MGNIAELLLYESKFKFKRKLMRKDQKRLSESILS